MNVPSDISPQDPAGSYSPAPVPEARRMYWSVRRELWENRAIYLAPLIVAAVVLLASALGTFSLPRRVRSLPTVAPAARHALIVGHYSITPAPIMLAAFIVGFFYCLEALYGERRDRSILFWKSLPVSDRTTVLSKLSIPFVVLPLIAFTLSVVTEVMLLQWASIILRANGLSPGTLWTEFRFFQGLVIMIYGLTVHALWFAPIYAWLLLISAWARRTPVLWAALPPFVIGMFEKFVFNTTYFGSMLRYRVIGAMTEAFAATPPHSGNIERLSQLDPARFLSAPGLWVGLLFAAAFLAAAMRVRRNREPL